MQNILNYNNPHYCPAYAKVVDADLCYETIMVFNKIIKASSVNEMREITDIEKSKKECLKCPYSNLD